MKICGKVIAILIRTLLHILCKVDRKELKKIPKEGPFIIAMNHINFLEVPLIFVDLYPRSVHGVAKKESWNNALLKLLANCWDSIPINREGFTADTFRNVRKKLKLGKFIVLAPEGTRTGDGVLIKAHPGIITMAMQSKVQIIPMAHYGGEDFWDNLVKFKRTKFTYRIGKPIKISTKEKGHSVRQELVDQLMYRIAELLPAKYRGYYDNIEKINNKLMDDLDYTQ